MKWADACNASPYKRAFRPLEDGTPNVVLFDNGKPKAFRAYDAYGWKRVPLKQATPFKDWTPADRMEP